MLSWLTRLFSKTETPSPPKDDLFDPEERLIYTYRYGYMADGTPLYRRKDPLDLWRRVMAHGPEISRDCKVAASLSKAAPERYDHLISTLQSVFDIKSPEEGGLAHMHLIQLLNHFMAYAQDLKKNTPLTSTSAWVTSPGSTNSDGGGAEPPPDSPSTSPSGSTGTVPSTEPPTPSDSESRSDRATPSGASPSIVP